jgi:MFS family permease
MGSRERGAGAAGTGGGGGGGGGGGRAGAAAPPPPPPLSSSLVRAGAPLLVVAAALDGSFAFFVIVIQAFLPDTLKAGAAAPGLALGIYGVTRVGIQMPGGILARRIGAWRLVRIGLLGGAAALLAMAAATTSIQVYVLTLIYGAATALAWPAVYLLAGDQTSHERGTLLGMITFCALGGMGAGLVFGALLVDAAPTRALLPAVAAALAAAGVGGWGLGVRGRQVYAGSAFGAALPTPHPPPPNPGSRTAALLPVIAFQGIGLAMLLPMLRQYAREQLGVELRDLVVLGAPAALAAAALFVPAGRLADRYGRAPLMAAGFGLAALGYLLLASADSRLLFALAVLPLAVGYAAGAPALAASISDLTDTSGRAVGLALTVQGLAFAAGPLLTAALVAGAGPAAALRVAAGVWLAATASALLPHVRATSNEAVTLQRDKGQA